MHPRNTIGHHLSHNVREYANTSTSWSDFDSDETLSESLSFGVRLFELMRIQMRDLDSALNFYSSSSDEELLSIDLSLESRGLFIAAQVPCLKQRLSYYYVPESFCGTGMHALRTALTERS